MAMSIEKMNQKLEKVLKKLDEAIENRDSIKVAQQIKEVKTLNEKSEGQQNDTILAELEIRINDIVQEINTNEELEADELRDLAQVRNAMKSGKDPFAKTKKVVDSLSEKGVTQEDIRKYKETQKNDNLTQIEGIKVANKDLSVKIADIEMRYIDKIENNDAAIKIIEEIKKQKDVLASLDSTTDATRISATNSKIKDKISELASKGVDVSSIQNFESNPGVIDTFHASKIAELRTNSDTLAVEITSDRSIQDRVKVQYGLDSVTNAKDLKDRYKEMVGTRQKYSTKVTTLEAENRQIDKTIKELDREEQGYGMYDEDGNRKTDREIAEKVLNDKRYGPIIERVVNEKFGGGIFKRLGARMDYYKETEEVGSVRAFFKALTTKTKTIKRLVAGTQAIQIGREISGAAELRMQKRQNDFRETIRKEAAKKMSKNSNFTENDIKEDIMSKAYESASKDDESR